MSEQGSLRPYLAPRVRDYGDLLDMTASVHVPFAQMGGGTELSFSAPRNDVGGVDTPDSQPRTPVAEPVPGGGDAGEVGDDDAGGGGGAGGGSGGGSGSGSGGGADGGGGAGGGELPFTGFAAGAAAAIGSGMALAGGALRRALRVRRGDGA